MKGAGVAASPDAVVGRWDVVTNVHGKDRHSALTISAEGGALAATLNDDEDGEIEVSAISFDDGILSYEYEAPQSQMSWAQVKGDEASSSTLIAWLKVTGDTFEGALSGEENPFDYGVMGKRRNKTTKAD